jgi:hypothetical protein
MLAEFAGRVRRHLREQALAPDEITDAVLEHEILRATATARDFSLRREVDVVALLSLFCRYFGTLSPDLPRSGLSILCRWGVEPEVKLRDFQVWSETEMKSAAGGAARRGQG